MKRCVLASLLIASIIIESSTAFNAAVLRRHSITNRQSTSISKVNKYVPVHCCRSSSLSMLADSSFLSTAVTQFSTVSASIVQSVQSIFGLNAAATSGTTVATTGFNFMPLLQVTAVLAALSTFGMFNSAEQMGHPYEDGNYVYNVEKMNRFYKNKPLFVIKRLFRLVSLAGTFGISLLLDWKLNKIEANEELRAKQALRLCTLMGPTFIKLGQALSIRTDLVSRTYINELKKLQDAVTPFDTAEAKSIICKELGIDDLKQRFKRISKLPVAAASIGQVYKATLYDGREVAIKVQRPKIMYDIALDLYILRTGAAVTLKLWDKIRNVAPELEEADTTLAFVDEWGRGLVAEVDYRKEAANTMQFIEAMKNRGLNAVTSAAVVPEYSTQRILVTEWIDGTRLDRDASADVPRLCGVAVNAYLTMLLDTGVLHCDPHPGNLLRTTDGRLCILDWGMTIGLPNDLQYSLLEFIAHVNAEDYDALPEDFVNLGFTPPDKVQQVRDSGLTDGFAFAFKQLSEGGGPAKIRERVKTELKTRYGEECTDDELRMRARQEMTQKMEAMLVKEGVDVTAMTNVMDTVSKRNRDIFKFPPYMLYVTRAFATLEGIGLSINEDYSILQECYPYLAKRLMSDDSPRSRKAMRAMITSGGMLSAEKLIEMTDGFTSYTSSTTSASDSNSGQNAIADLILDEQGNMMQDILLESAANVTDALVREGYYRWKESTSGRFVRGAIKGPRDLVNTLVPDALKMFMLPLTLPLTLPYDITKALSTLIDKDDSDSETVQAISKLWKALEPKIVGQMQANGQASLSNSPSSIRDIVGIISTIDPADLRKAINASNIKRLPAIAKFTRRYGATLMYRTSDRLGSKKILGNGKLQTSTTIPTNELIASSNASAKTKSTSKGSNGGDSSSSELVGNASATDDDDDLDGINVELDDEARGPGMIQLRKPANNKNANDRGDTLNRKKQTIRVRRNNSSSSRRTGDALEELDVEDRLNVQLMISILSSVSSATARRLAKALDDRANTSMRNL